MADTPRCYVTGNPCGTDTVMEGFDCPGTGGRCRNKPTNFWTVEELAKVREEARLLAVELGLNPPPSHCHSEPK